MPRRADFRTVFGLLLVAMSAGCGDSSSKTAEPARPFPNTTIDLDASPTAVPPPRIRPLIPEGSRSRIIATIQERGGKVTADETGIIAVDWQQAPIHNLDLELLTEAPELERLYLSGTKIDSRSFAYLASLPHLKRLALWRTPIQDDDLQYLSGAKDLEVLDLSRTRITGSGLVHLAECQKLKTLILHDTQCGRDALPAISKLKSLRLLDLNFTQVRNRDIAVLKSLPDLEELRFHVVPEALPILAGFPNIRRLTLRRFGFPHPMRNLSYLSKMPRLESIEIAQGDVRDDFFEHVSQCPNLRELRVRGSSRFTDKGVQSLHDRPTLRLLDVRDTRATPAALKSLARANPKLRILVNPIELHRLSSAFESMGLGAVHSDGGPRLRLNREMDITHLRLDDAKVFPQSLKLIGQAVDAESLQVLSLSRTRLTDEMLGLFPIAPNLRSLNLSKTQITPAGLKAWDDGDFLDLQKLQSLDLSWLTLDDEMLHWIGSLERLKSLRLLGDSGASPEAWAALGRLRLLEELDCSKSDWSDETLAALKPLENLRTLRLGLTDIRGAGLANLKNFPKLQSLDLSDTVFDPAEVQHLAELQQLRQLNLSGAVVDDPDVFQTVPLAVVASLENLESLSLSGSITTNEELLPLRTLTRLRVLDLSGNCIDANCFETLKAMPHLEAVDLRATLIAPHEIAALEKSNPNLRIRH